MTWQIASVLISGGALLFNFIVIVGGWYVAHKLMTNDLHHLGLDIKEVTKKLEKFEEETKNSFTNQNEHFSNLVTSMHEDTLSITERMAKVEATCKARHN